ncbi:MAG: helix-turn-helix transcriptional regulator [Chloroflexi bacterium]|nr:helix-turn-helix transcriptional regulator [Chloroflexota bacterium]
MLDDATLLSEQFSDDCTAYGSVRALLGPRIRRVRLERLGGQNLEVFGREIAAMMGRGKAFSNVTISNWETGRQEPSLEALVAIARLSRLPLRYFAGVGDLDDYPWTDWFGTEQDGNVEAVRELFERSELLEPPRRELLLAEVSSLISNLYRVLGSA